jgi:membrane protease YdiL (CAAX protease family)
MTLVFALIFALFAWYLLFGAKLVNFWYGMAAAAGILAIWAIIWAERSRRKKLFEFHLSYILWGIGSAALLYGVFWVGNAISIQLFPFASGQIAAVYGNKAQLDPLKIGLLLMLWIGPAEEIFWRGMLQRILAQKFGANFGWIAGALIYAAVHIWAMNFMLFMAALICGLYWGWIYKRFGSLWPGIISHALWDVFIFLIIPV